MQKLVVASFVVLFALSGFSVDAAPPINAPSDLSATAVSSSQIDLNWQDNSDDETGFEIERSLDGISFSKIAEVGANVASYSDIGLSKATTYHYRVRAFKFFGKNKVAYSDYSNIASAVTFDTVPEAPSNLIATHEIYGATTTDGVTTTDDRVKLEWQDNSDNEKGFEIERSTDGVNFAVIHTVPANYTYTYDYAVEGGITYYYRIRAYNDFGYSSYSNVAEVTIP
jgi:titin